MKRNLLSLISAFAILCNLCCTTTVSASAYFSDTRTVNYTRTWGNNSALGSYATAADKAKYQFTVADGDTYSLLDVDSTSGASRYFVITDAPYVKKNFKNNENPNYFATEDGTTTYSNGDEHADAYPSWHLNSKTYYGDNTWRWHDYNGSQKIIDPTVREYIDFTHIWDCEPATPDANDYPTDPAWHIGNAHYTTVAGIMFPSAGEIAAYADRFLTYNEPTFVTRTMRTGGTGRQLGVANASETSSYPKYQAIVMQNTANGESGQQNVRPVFWLNDQFFANVAVDLSTAGEAVKQEIRKVGYDNLLSIYSAGDLDTYLFDMSQINSATARFTDVSNNTLTNLNDTTSVKVTADLITAVPGIDAYAILAVYLTDGTLEKVGISHLQSEEKYVNDFSISLTGLSNANGKSAKLMIWNDLDRTIWSLSDFVAMP